MEPSKALLLVLLTGCSSGGVGTSTLGGGPGAGGGDGIVEAPARKKERVQELNLKEMLLANDG